MLNLRKPKSKKPGFDVNLDVIRKLEPVLRMLREYHRHDVQGLHHIPKRGRALIVINHSLATYDISLLIHAVYMHNGRILRALIDRLFYKIPYLAELMQAVGCIEGNKANAEELLGEGNLVAVAPGGMQEALRPSTEKYTLKWEHRQGFARLSIITQTPVILAFCPRADDLYRVYNNPVTSWVYEKLRVPVFFASGLGLTPIPRPVHLTHFLSEPIRPPRQNPDPEKFQKQVERFHKKIIQKSEELMMVGSGKLLPKEEQVT